ncbi:MAG TPA: hypothetical protein VF958_12950, partial [Thermoanaerobaculia bacterium]
HFHLGMVAVLRSRHGEALAEFEKALVLSHSQPLEVPIRAYGLAVGGRRTEALAILGKVDGGEKGGTRTPSVPVANASVYAFLGLRDEAFRCLEVGFADRFPEMVFLKVHPLLSELRGDPRFADLVRRMGL